MIERTELPQVLREMLRRHRLPHALLLEGEEGASLRETALTVAAAALCQRDDGVACGACPACRKVLDLCHSDVIIMEYEQNKELFRKDSIRALRAAAYRKPVEGRIKFYIFLPAEKLDPEVQTLLLKIIEEPPEDTCFILACHNRSRLLPTVLSRVTGVELPPLTQQARDAWRSADPQRARLWADAAEAKSALCAADGYRFLQTAARYEKNRDGYAHLLDALLCCCEDPQQHGDLLYAAQLVEANAHLPLVSALLAARGAARG